MTKFNFLHSEVNVHFTLDELYRIALALGFQSLSYRDKGHQYSSDIYWALRDKVFKFIDLYENSKV